MNEPNVTVIVTVYNIEPYLERFFECLGRQTYDRYVVLMIDDGSEDGSLEVCRAHARSDPRIRLIESEHIGISAARNLALDNIETEFVTSLDADDFFDERYLEHLVNAEKRYGADLVISNVIYLDEALKEFDRFVPRDEAVYRGDALREVLPALLEERRLNYLYAKLYKTRFLKDVRLEPDVKQGSDTMINSMYVTRIDSIAVTEDYDYSYIKYSKRSVTSYGGTEMFDRLYRINEFVLDTMSEAGLLSDEMLRVIDGRILQSGMFAVRRISKLKAGRREKYRLAGQIVGSSKYLTSYNRRVEAGDLDSFVFDVIKPGTEKAFINNLRRNSRFYNSVENIRDNCPPFLLNIWHKINRH